MRGPYPSTGVVSVLHSCEHVAHSCARCRTNVRALVSGRLDDPRADLEWLKPRSREFAVDLEGRGGPYDVEPGVTEVRLPFAKVDRPGRADRPGETQRGGGLLALRVHEAEEERSVRSGTKRAEGDRCRLIDERNEGLRTTVARTQKWRREPRADAPGGRGDFRALVERDDAVAVLARPDALR